MFNGKSEQANYESANENKLHHPEERKNKSERMGKLAGVWLHKKVSIVNTNLYTKMLKGRFWAGRGGSRL